MAIFPTNASLTFQLPTAEAGIDAIGNPVSNGVEVVIEASFKGSSLQPQDSDNPGYRVDRTKLIGRVNRAYRNTDPIIEITPPSLPPEIVPGVQVPCVLTDLGTGTTQDGYFVLELAIASRWQIDKILGGKINGWFTVSNVMGELA